MVRHEDGMGEIRNYHRILVKIILKSERGLNVRITLRRSRLRGFEVDGIDWESCQL
jgi:hypothetical protein